jgi:hypothetical protein
MSRLGRTLNKPIVVLVVGVVAVVLNVLLYCGLFVLWYRTPLIIHPEPSAAGESVEPIPPSKTLLEPKPDPEEGRGGDGA